MYWEVLARERRTARACLPDASRISNADELRMKHISGGRCRGTYGFRKLVQPLLDAGRCLPLEQVSALASLQQDLRHIAGISGMLGRYSPYRGVFGMCNACFG